MKNNKTKTVKEKYDHMTTIWVKWKDRIWLRRIMKKLEKKGVGSVISSMIDLIKFHKMEDELK